MATEPARLLPSILWFFSGGGRYDLVISDMARDDESAAGLKFVEQFCKDDKAAPLIFYVGEYGSEKGLPARAFGITNRPDELLHLTLDALERKKS